jgi:hypothetical protein
MKPVVPVIKNGYEISSKNPTDAQISRLFIPGFNQQLVV